MTRTDYKTLFTALGFLAVILDDKPQEHQAQRAIAIARLIEEFCAASVPETFGVTLTEAQQAHASELLEAYIAELRETGSARLSYDRTILLGMYELLLIQKMRFEQREFFASGHDDVIANQILRLAEERIERERRA